MVPSVQCCKVWLTPTTGLHIADEERIISANSLGALYQFLNKRTANQSSTGVVRDDSGSLLTNSVDTANAFNKYFSSVGVVDCA